MRRIAYAGLITMMTMTPLAIVWASDRGPASTRGVSRSEHYHRSSNFYYFGGGHGGWAGNSYGWGKGGSGWERGSGASRYRSGGPKAGGK
jgi:hypothetical protein